MRIRHSGKNWYRSPRNAQEDRDLQKILGDSDIRDGWQVRVINSDWGNTLQNHINSVYANAGYSTNPFIVTQADQTKRSGGISADYSNAFELQQVTDYMKRANTPEQLSGVGPIFQDSFWQQSGSEGGHFQYFNFDKFMNALQRHSTGSSFLEGLADNWGWIDAYNLEHPDDPYQRWSWEKKEEEDKRRRNTFNQGLQERQTDAVNQGLAMKMGGRLLPLEEYTRQQMGSKNYLDRIPEEYRSRAERWIGNDPKKLGFLIAALNRRKF